MDEIFHRCRDDKEKGLRIRLRVDPEELSLLPWEYCFDPATRQYLALERQTPIVRYIAEGFAAPTLTMPRRVKLLVVLAAPCDQPELDMAREEAGIRQALQNVPAELPCCAMPRSRSCMTRCWMLSPISFTSAARCGRRRTGALALEKPGTGLTDPLTARHSAVC